jgi:hypothetical protein
MQVTEDIYRLIYVSRSRIEPSLRAETLKSIFLRAREHNASIEVTGALYISPDCFVQTLEGEKSAVLAVFAEIAQDLRHDLVEIVHEGPMEQRVFSTWAMAEVADFPEHSDIHYRLDTSGATPQVMLDNPDPGENILLTVMRFYLEQAQGRESPVLV